MKRIERSGAEGQRKPGLRSGSFCIIDSQVPVAGRDYPRNRKELERMFSSRTNARRFLEKLRFPRGFVCVHCGSRERPWRSGTGLLACVTCRKPTRLEAGTMFDGSTIPLERWLQALWETADSEVGLNSAMLTQVLRVRDAAPQLARLRAVMARSSPARLCGEVELGLARLEIDGRHHAVVLAYGGEGYGKPRIRLRFLPTLRKRSVVRFVVDNVEDGSTLRTSCWAGFSGVGGAGFVHRPSQRAATATSAELARVVGTLELWLYGQSTADVASLQGCLDEFAFRYNRREYPVGLLFYRLMILAVKPSNAEAGGHLARAAG